MRLNTYADGNIRETEQRSGFMFFNQHCHSRPDAEDNPTTWCFQRESREDGSGDYHLRSNFRALVHTSNLAVQLSLNPDAPITAPTSTPWLGFMSVMASTVGSFLKQAILINTVTEQSPNILEQSERNEVRCPPVALCDTLKKGLETLPHRQGLGATRQHLPGHDVDGLPRRGRGVLPRDPVPTTW